MVGTLIQPMPGRFGYDFATTGGGLLGGQAAPGGGILGGFGSSFRQLLDPQTALPMAAALIGGRNPQESLAGAFAAAAPGLAATKRRMVVNDWLKAGSPRDPAHPATQALLAAAPELASAYAGSIIAPKKAPDFVKIGEDQMGGATYGWADPNSQTVTPYTPAGGGAVGQELPGVSLGADGLPDPAAQKAFLDSIPDTGTRKLVQGLANYEIDPTKTFSLKGNHRERAVALAKQYDPTYDQTQFGARSAMRKSMTSGPYSQVLNATNQVIQHIDALNTAYDGLNNTSYPAWNAVSNAAATETGNEKIQKAKGEFDTSADAVASELAKVFKGTGASSEQEVLEWRQNLSPNMPPAQFKASLNTLIGKLLASRLDTLNAQFKASMGTPADFRTLTPHTKEVLSKFGIDLGSGALGDTAVPDRAQAAPQQGGPVQITGDADYNALPSGAHFFGPDGHERVKP